MWFVSIEALTNKIQFLGSFKTNFRQFETVKNCFRVVFNSLKTVNNRFWVIFIQSTIFQAVYTANNCFSGGIPERVRNLPSLLTADEDGRTADRLFYDLVRASQLGNIILVKTCFE
jgi:hypothetical protein